MELWDLLDEDGLKTGKTVVRGQPIAEGYYYVLVQIFVANSQRQFLVQKRSRLKKAFPGIWAVTGGAVLAGEDSRDAARRELWEEMGVALPREALRFASRVRGSRAFLDMWTAHTDMAVSDMVLQPGEVDGAKFVSAKDLIDIVAPDRGRKNPAYYRSLIALLESEQALTEIRADG